jgi:hypothetical protein
MTVALALVGFLAFADHVLRPAEIAARIGWPTHPNFQFELGACLFGLRGRSAAGAVDTQSPLLAWRRSRPLHFHRPGRHQSSTRRGRGRSCALQRRHRRAGPPDPRHPRLIFVPSVPADQTTPLMRHCRPRRLSRADHEMAAVGATEPSRGVRERALLPHARCSRYASGSAQLGKRSAQGT